MDLDRGLPLCLRDFDRLGALTGAFGSPLSEYCVANLYLFRTVHDYRFHAAPHPAISGRTSAGVPHLMPLDRHALAGAPPSGYVLYPVAYEDAAGRDASFNPDDSDYVYRCRDLSGLSGAVRKAKRNMRSSFRRRARPRDEMFEARHHKIALDILDGWLADVSKPWAETDYLACREALDLAATLAFRGLVCFTDAGEPAGFVLASDLADGSVAVHFAKGRRKFPGVSEHMLSRFAALCENRCTHINFEQDLGRPGFRQAKRSFGPAFQLHKFRIRPRG
jgi:hypothetical protein